MTEPACLGCRVGDTHTFHDNGEPNLEYAYEGTEPPSHSQNPHDPLAGVGWGTIQRQHEECVKQHLAKRKGDPRFLALLDDIEALHAAKQADYGRDADPFANVRASEEWGVSPYIGALIRLTDKVRRLQTYAIKGSLSNEGVEDSLMDLAVYSLIALILFREEESA